MVDKNIPQGRLYITKLDYYDKDYGSMWYYRRYSDPLESLEATIKAPSRVDADVFLHEILKAINECDLNTLLTLIAKYIDGESPNIDIHSSEVEFIVKVNIESGK